MVVEELTEEEQNFAARTSYAYWAWEQNQTPDGSSMDAGEKNEVRIRMAMREARRHFVGQGADYDSAVERLKNSVQWREVRFL